MSKTIFFIALGVFSIASMGVVLSDSDREKRDDRREYAERRQESPRGGWLESKPDVRVVANDTYRSECGDCHFAYQPGLLPGSAWAAVMDSLADHFGDDATLDEGMAAEIRRYLLDNAADRAKKSRSRAFAKGAAAGKGLPRITTTPYFLKEYDEISARLVQENEQVGSFSNCQACHRGAERGVYNEHQVVIPGFGPWDD